jgi:hypothetical protein
MSQFQQGVGTQLAGMTMPDQFALAEQAGQGSAAGLQALLGVQAPEFGSMDRRLCNTCRLTFRM